MQAYPGYIENGKIISIGNPALPDGYKAIITILDETVSTDTCRETVASTAPLTKPL
jgi:hypothetical protein